MRPPFGRITRDFDCPKPLIAAVNGVALGGGLEMALACDIIVAADHARFGLPEPRVGLFAAAGGVHRLVRQVLAKPAMGPAADRPHVRRRRGVAPRPGQRGRASARPDVRRRALGQEILECSPLSVRLTKEAALDGLAHSVDDALARDEDRVRRLLASADFVEVPNAFAERRKPRWTGRDHRQGAIPCWTRQARA